MGQYGEYGWYPSLPDIRNKVANTFGMAVADTVDLRPTKLLPDVWDQSQLGACTAHGTGAAWSFDVAKQGGLPNLTPSRLFIYYNSRAIENTIPTDAGATCADAIKSINKFGAPLESDWAYDIAKFADKPPEQAFTDGTQSEAVKYASVPQTVQGVQAILTSGYPVVIGFTVYASFESDAVAANGVVPMPSPSEAVMGGHCVLVVGYLMIDGKPYWICRNSWGSGWGDGGYFYLPQQYLTDANLASDFWVVQQVSSPDPTPTPPAPVPPSPAPTPSPTPAPADADAALVEEANKWMQSIWSKITAAGKLKTALINWEAEHGYE